MTTLFGLFQTLWEFSVNKKDLRALNLEGPPKDNPEIDPLAVIHLDNQLCIPFVIGTEKLTI